MDYALLSRLQLQSTSDQQDFRRNAAIAAAAPRRDPGAPWLALAMRAPTTYVLAWHRNGLGEPDEDEADEDEDEAGVVLPLPHLAGRQVTAQVSYPLGGADVSWDAGPGELTVTMGRPRRAA